MMRRFLVLTMALLLAFSLISRAEAAIKFSVDGFRIDTNGEMSFTSLMDEVATNQTVTAAQTGAVFILDSSLGPIIMTLPDAADGLTYKFIGVDTSAFLVKPDSTDTLTYSTSSTGQALMSSGTVADTITIYGTDDSVWFVDTNSTFAIIGY